MSVPEKNTTTAPTDIKADYLLALIAEEMLQVRSTIRTQLASDYEHITVLLKRINAAKGKMLRPAILLLAAKCVGSVNQSHIKIAAIIEMIHNATLLHDDVIDAHGYQINANGAVVIGLNGNF